MCAWIFPFVVLAALAIPAAAKAKSWKQGLWAFARAFGLSALIVVLPLAVFGLSGFLVPEAKSLCGLGWFDCFHVGKLLLSPVVLWAVGSLYALEVLGTSPREEPMVGLGVFLGAIVSLVCSIHGLLTLVASPYMREMGWGLLVPLCVFAWYAVRTVRVVRSSDIDPWTYLYCFLVTVPLWIFSVIVSRVSYSRLPDYPDPVSCFVVTAASKGHRSVVGPHVDVVRGGKPRTANAQLLAFWEFERLWAGAFPESHRGFRKLYNVWGVRAAGLIRNPWAADAAFILIKPAELVARSVVGVARNRGTRGTLPGKEGDPSPSPAAQGQGDTKAGGPTAGCPSRAPRYCAGLRSGPWPGGVRG